MPSQILTRRSLLRTAGIVMLPVAAVVELTAATPFWNRKQPSDWSADEITQLLNRSPWARETNLDFEAIEGGHIEMPPTGAPPQPGESGNKTLMTTDPSAGAMRRTPVIVRWESAQPLRDALQFPFLPGFDGRYVISVANVPPGIMNKRRRGGPDEIALDDLLAELQGAATLEVTGKDPVGAGVVRRVPGSENNYMFGFAKELLPLTGNEKEVLFILRTARISVKVRFEPKNMMYHGKLAV